MRLRTRLSLLFALFAAGPLVAVFVPVTLTLARSLSYEHASRLDAAARTAEAELQALAAAAGDGVRDLAGRPEVAGLAGELADGSLAAPDAAARLREWGASRGLSLLALCDADGRVAASAHLPGRAGDVDPALAPPLAAPPGRAVPVLAARADGAGVERVAALLAWAEVPGTGLRAVGGLPLDGEGAARLAQRTGAAVTVRDGAGHPLAEAAGGTGPAAPLALAAARLLGLAERAGREVPLGPAEAPVARLEVSLGAEGLVTAGARVVVAFLASLAAAGLAAALAGRLLAGRITGPVEALRGAATRVASGDLGARVGVAAEGEVGELVAAFDRMTADLERGRARLAAAERVAAWREVARRLAHEIKNPLTPIAMSVETLRDARGRPEFDEVLEESTRAVTAEVRRLKRIVDEFGRFARLPVPELAEVPAGGLAQDLAALYASPPAGVTVERRIEPGLPAVLADRDQLLQVLHNLVKNALEAMPAGGRLRLGARREGDEVVFEVSDTGVGIAPERLARIFEPYETGKPGGTGLGLAIAERIVQEHGGRIEVESRPGAGATFTVRLPAVSGPASP